MRGERKSLCEFIPRRPVCGPGSDCRQAGGSQAADRRFDEEIPPMETSLDIP